MLGVPTTVPRRVPTRFLHGSYVPYNSCGVVQLPGQAHFKHTIMVPLSFEKVIIVTFELCELMHLRSPCPCTDVLWCVRKAKLQEMSVCSRDPQPHVCSYLNTTSTTFSFSDSSHPSLPPGAMYSNDQPYEAMFDCQGGSVPSENKVHSVCTYA